jgi:UDP-N-acetylglucosamine 2-epimerase (non-hydrolysing)
MIRIVHVVGARPNFIKVAPVVAALENRGLRQTLVHTGQHYTENMSDVFFAQLGIPEPDINLCVGSGSHAEQTSEIMIRFERVLREQKPDLVMVYGDVNSTLAASLVCAKLLVPVAHVEAGLRSFDRTMPEEVNRVLTDQVSSLLFTHSVEADRNLTAEGISVERIHCVGNVMVDTLCRLLPKAKRPCGLDVPSRFALVTLHRPSNVDDEQHLRRLLESLGRIGRALPVIFPVHPRTSRQIAALGLNGSVNGVVLLDPLPYLEFLFLQRNAAVVVTDSGGVQEETTFLGIPCLTIRENTERPVTIQFGTNTLVGREARNLEGKVEEVLNGQYKKGAVPPLWDGCAAGRIAEVICSNYRVHTANPARLVYVGLENS